MNRQLLVGRFGINDQVNMSVGTDEQCTFLQLISEQDSLSYGMSEALTDLKKHGIYPSEVGVDLLILAAHVHAADTRISRLEQSQDSWTREIRLVVPVSDPDLWNSAESILKSLLNFLTGDRWELNFRARPKEFQVLVESTPSLIPHAFDSLSLFSGGLDSLIGTIDLLESGKSPLLVSHAGDGSTSSAQNKLMAGLKDAYKQSGCERLRVWMTFQDGLINGVASEDTTRGRSFLFFALGVLAGTGYEKHFTLLVPENGLIALNVPLDPLRLGANSTRTTHPYYMNRWNDLLAQLGIDGEIKNPCWNKTKGEMAAECKNSSLLKQLSTISLSCSAPAKGRFEGRGIEHCGYCLPCLIRRASLETAWGVGNDKTTYTLSDLRVRNLDTNLEEGVQIRSFQYSIARLKKQPELAKILIHKPGSLADETANLDQLAGVYLRGLMEVDQLITGVVTKPS